MNCVFSCRASFALIAVLTLLASFPSQAWLLFFGYVGSSINLLLTYSRVSLGYGLALRTLIHSMSQEDNIVAWMSFNLLPSSLKVIAFYNFLQFLEYILHAPAGVYLWGAFEDKVPSLTALAPPPRPFPSTELKPHAPQHDPVAARETASSCCGDE